MKELYPYLKGQEDIVTMTEADFKLRTGRELPALFIEKMLNARRITILKHMEEGRPIKLDRLGKLLITPKTRDKKEILDSLGDNITEEGFRKELRYRFLGGKLHSQRYTKITGTRKAKNYGRFFRFKVSESNRNGEYE